MSRWFRWYEGTCEDGKFRAVARNANVTVATVMGVWAVLLEDASNGEQRGVAERGFAFYAAVLDLPDAQVESILASMHLLKLIAGDQEKIEITKWKERQFETDAADSTNADRQRRWREKHKKNGHVTERNGSVTAEKRPDTDTDTDTDTDKKRDAAPTGAQVVSIAPTPEKIFFDQAVQYLGADARSLAAKLLKAKGGNVPAAHAALLTAVQKSNPREYVGAIIRGRDSVEDLRARGEAW